MGKIKKLFEKKRVRIISFLILFFAIGFLFLPDRGQSPVYSLQYFSGIDYIKVGKGWFFDASLINDFKSIHGWGIYLYRFKSIHPDIIPYSINNTGLVYITWLLGKIFFFVGPIGALLLGQVILHILITIYTAEKILTKNSRLLFYLFYGVNPIVIKMVVFPYYYFWTFIPSLVFIIISEKSSFKPNIFFQFLIAILLVIAFGTRSTVIFTILLIFLFLLIQKRIKFFIPLIVSFVLIFFLYNKYFSFSKNYHPWHTAYIGLGAYPNPYGIKIASDDEGTDYFYSVTGKQLSNSIKGNYYDENNLKEYNKVLKERDFYILKSNPYIFIRNGILNYLQSFTFGTIVNRGYYINYLLSLIGFMVLIFLVFKKEFWGILAISSATLSFCLFYPPIIAYMFGGIFFVAFYLAKQVPDLFRSRLLQQNNL